MAPKSLASRWSSEDSSELYNIGGWANGYFSATPAGTLAVHPEGEAGPRIDLKELVDEVSERGIGLPLLIRFSEIVKARVEELHAAFEGAIDAYDYRGSYQGVYPIKVNQNRFLVEKLVEYGRPYNYGLEAGSKPELLAVMAMLDDPAALIICNGYKDEEYVETALLASKLGLRVVLVVEKQSELELVRRVAERTKVRPMLGIRARLSARGSGHWEESGGDGSKFGLGSRGLVAAVHFLAAADMLDCFQLLHFHIGSQISAIRSVKEALREASRLYVNLVRMGAPLGFLDVGGGLGVDYDGSGTDFASSLNYTLQEYANDVVFGVKDVCDSAGVAHPVLVSESGRATVAHHAALVVETLGVAEFTVGEIPEALPDDVEAPLRNLLDGHHELSEENFLETFHDALSYRDECLSLFSLGHLSLEHRALADDIFLATCRRILDIARARRQMPDELESLEHLAADTYFCNFSIFQSLPDSWAIDQLFPVMPIHRLDEEPERRATLADITCDSDGKIDRFIDRRQVKRLLELHRLRPGEPYLLGVFLVGAYQESLGDLHNLFGDTNTVQVSLDREGGYSIDDVVEGDTVTEVLRYVRYSRRELLARIRRSAEGALRRGMMSRQEARDLISLYETGLSGYTYLEH
ncbi:MAG: biosynthetic arginine decarboxylase [Acidobacteriota bacterium]